MKKVLILIAMIILTVSVTADVVKYDKPKETKSPISKPNHPLGNK